MVVDIFFDAGVTARERRAWCLCVAWLALYVRVRACARVYVDDHIRSSGDHAWFFNFCRNGKGGLFTRMFREECLSGLVTQGTPRLKCAHVQNLSYQTRGFFSML